MVINNLTKGILIGVGASAVGFYLYKRNERKVDDFLSRHGVQVAGCQSLDLADMNLEQLMETKETIEDIIAERELAEDEQVVIVSREEKPAPKTKAKPSEA